MKIQLAIDRVTIEKSKKIASEAGPYIDIIEVGTSLIKDYGVKSIREMKQCFPDKTILADMKTIDEGAYEFNAAFSNGADIATVMGISSVNTLKACQETARKLNKLMMIDLLGMDDERIYNIREFSDAIFCIHMPSDGGSGELTSLLNDFRSKFPEIKRVAVAGGIDYKTMNDIKNAGADIVIIGGAIARADSIAASARKFREMI